MRKHKGAAGTLLAEKPVETAYVVIDFPRDKEVVTFSEYTIRIGASAEAASVEVSIDDSVWKPCRNAVGFWWFDWSGYPKGKHDIKARLVAHDGRAVEGAKRAFTVKLPVAAGSAKRPTRISKVRTKLTKMLGDAGINIG